MLASSSSTLVTMASHLSEAGERERLLNGKTRWTQVRSLGEAKSLLNYLFGIASSSTCEVQDKHAACVEKDHLANELKEKVIRVTSLLRQSESDKTHLEQKLQACVPLNVSCFLFSLSLKGLERRCWRRLLAHWGTTAAPTPSERYSHSSCSLS